MPLVTVESGGRQCPEGAQTPTACSFLLLTGLTLVPRSPACGLQGKPHSGFLPEDASLSGLTSSMRMNFRFSLFLYHILKSF